jgi:hypothetical protein
MILDLEAEIVSKAHSYKLSAFFARCINTEESVDSDSVFNFERT